MLGIVRTTVMGSIMAPKHKTETILVIGPGPRKATGTDQYAHGVVGACTALAEAGHPVVLLDNAPYLALPDKGLDIKRHIEPLTRAVVAQLATEFDARWVYAEAGGDGAQRLAAAAQGLKPLGSGPAITALALDRSRLFAKLAELGLPVPAYAIVDTAPAALDAAQSIDFPQQVTLMPAVDTMDTAIAASAASTSALLYNQSDLQEWVEQQLDIYPGAKLLLERVDLGWQRFEVIVLRDEAGHQAIAGLQAYLEPTGISTADASWVQPPVKADAQLTEALAKTSRSLFESSDLKGVASLTIAVHPTSGKGVILNLNLGTSRNIAFCAAASGLPLYEMVAKIALGTPLAEVWREAPSETVAVRLPVAPVSGTQPAGGRPDIMAQPLGDVMGVGEDFSAAFGNALNSCGAVAAADDEIPLDGGMTASPRRYLEMRTALKEGVHGDSLSERAGIAPWLAEALSEWAAEGPMGAISETTEPPFVQTRVTTDTGERFRWERLEVAAKSDPLGTVRRILVIAGRPNTIGQSRELDLAASQAVTAIKRHGCEAVILSSDPLSAVNRLNDHTQVCLGPANLATIEAIHRNRPLDGVMLQCVPGQLLNLAEALVTAGIPVLGPSARAVTLLASPMALHERLTDLGIPHPQRALATDAERAREQAEVIGYPLLLKPLNSAQGHTNLIMNAKMLQAQIQAAAAMDTPYMMEEFIEFAIEVTADAICDGVDASIPQTVEHIELAGIHPGDSAWVIPPYSTSLRHVDTISEYLHKIAVELAVKGPLSGRFAVFNDTVYLLDVELAFTRTAAMVSEACGLPLFAAATRAMLGESLDEIQLSQERQLGFTVREAIFPVSHQARLASRLGPVMQSTGEVIGQAETFGRAYYKSQEAAGDLLPTTGSVLITVTDSDKPSIIEPARRYRELGFRLMATRGTAAFLSANGIPTETVRKLGMGRPDLVDAIKTQQVDLVINTPSGHQGQMDDGYIRKAAIQYNIPYISTPAGAQAAAKGIAAQRRLAKVKRKIG